MALLNAGLNGNCRLNARSRLALRKELRVLRWRCSKKRRALHTANINPSLSPSHLIFSTRHDAAPIMEERLQLNLCFAKITEPNSQPVPFLSLPHPSSSVLFSHIKLNTLFSTMPSAPSSPSSSSSSPFLSYTGSTVLSAPSTPSTGIPYQYANAITPANVIENASTVSTHHDLPLPPPVTPTSSACAACKYQRRKCGPTCMLAPYFPPKRQKDFQNAHKLFGVSNIVKKLCKLSPPDRQKAVDTMVFEATMHATDPPGGCRKLIYELENQLTFLQNELSKIQSILAFCRNEPGHSDTNLHLHDEQYDDQSRSSLLSSDGVNPSQNKLQNLAQDQLPYFYFVGNLADGKNNHNADVGNHGIACNYVNNDNHYHTETEVEQESEQDEIRSFMDFVPPICSESEEGDGELVCKSGVDMASLNLALANPNHAV